MISGRGSLASSLEFISSTSLFRGARCTAPTGGVPVIMQLSLNSAIEASRSIPSRMFASKRMSFSSFCLNGEESSTPDGADSVTECAAKNFAELYSRRNSGSVV